MSENNTTLTPPSWAVTSDADYEDVVVYRSKDLSSDPSISVYLERMDTHEGSTHKEGKVSICLFIAGTNIVLDLDDTHALLARTIAIQLNVAADKYDEATV